MSVGRLSSSHLLQRPASAALPALSTCPVRRAGLLREGGGRGAGYHRGLGQWRTPPRPHRNPKTAAGPKSTTDSEVPWRPKTEADSRAVRRRLRARRDPNGPGDVGRGCHLRNAAVSGLASRPRCRHRIVAHARRALAASLLRPDACKRPAGAGLLRNRPKTDSYLPIALDVLTLRDDLIVGVTAFRTPSIFPRFQLPERLPAR
jgi:hypothetical protein